MRGSSEVIVKSRDQDQIWSFPKSRQVSTLFCCVEEEEEEEEETRTMLEVY